MNGDRLPGKSPSWRDALDAEYCRATADGAPDDSKPDVGKPDDDKPKVSQATLLVQLAEARYRLGQSERGDPFGTPHQGPNIARMLRGDRDSIRAELSAAFAAEHGKVPSSAALADALLVLEGRAQSCDREPVALRVARHGRHVILDLGEADGRAAIVTSDGWTVDASPVLFRRTALTDPLPEPTRGGSLNALWELLNVTPADRPLVAAWLAMALLGERPCPVLALLGEHGTAKTSAGKLLAALIDSPDALRAPPRDLEGWIVAADSSRVVGLDNLTRIGEWLSDAICRTVTGEALVRRKLYTDTGVSRVAFRRPVILTAIATGALRGDLADRLLAVELDRIPEGHRRLDAEVDARWADIHPSALGGLLDLLVAVLGVLPKVTLDRYPRMADYARVLAAVDMVWRTDGLGRYRGKAGQLAADVVEADPVASAVRDLVNDKKTWEGPVSVLLEAITNGRDHIPKDWPANAQAMASALKRTAPGLRAVGVEVDRIGQDPQTRRVLYRLRQREVAKDPSDPSQPSEPTNGAGSAPKDPSGSEGSDPSRHPGSFAPEPLNHAVSKVPKDPKDLIRPPSGVMSPDPDLERELAEREARERGDPDLFGGAP